MRNDTFAVLRAGTDRHWGVGVVCGFGTNCSAVAPDGRVTRFPAVGPISGDWGGGRRGRSRALVRDPCGGWSRLGHGAHRAGSIALRARRPRQVLEAVYYDWLKTAWSSSRRSCSAPRRRAMSRGAWSTARPMRSWRWSPRRSSACACRSWTSTSCWAAASSAPRTRSSSSASRPACARWRLGAIQLLTDPPVIGAAWLGLDRLLAPKASYARARRALTHGRLDTHTRAGRKEHR